MEKSNSLTNFRAPVSPNKTLMVKKQWSSYFKDRTPAEEEALERKKAWRRTFMKSINRQMSKLPPLPPKPTDQKEESKFRKSKAPLNILDPVPSSSQKGSTQTQELQLQQTEMSTVRLQEADVEQLRNSKDTQISTFVHNRPMRSVSEYEHNFGKRLINKSAFSEQSEAAAPSHFKQVSEQSEHPILEAPPSPINFANGRHGSMLTLEAGDMNQVSTPMALMNDPELIQPQLEMQPDLEDPPQEAEEEEKNIMCAFCSSEIIEKNRSILRESMISLDVTPARQESELPAKVPKPLEVCNLKYTHFGAAKFEGCGRYYCSDHGCFPSNEVPKKLGCFDAFAYSLWRELPEKPLKKSNSSSSSGGKEENIASLLGLTKPVEVAWSREVKFCEACRPSFLAQAREHRTNDVIWTKRFICCCFLLLLLAIMAAITYLVYQRMKGSTGCPSSEPFYLKSTCMASCPEGFFGEQVSGSCKEVPECGAESSFDKDQQRCVKTEEEHQAELPEEQERPEKEEAPAEQASPGNAQQEITSSEAVANQPSGQEPEPEEDGMTLGTNSTASGSSLSGQDGSTTLSEPEPLVPAENSTKLLLSSNSSIPVSPADHGSSASEPQDEPVPEEAPTEHNQSSVEDQWVNQTLYTSLPSINECQGQYIGPDLRVAEQSLEKYSSWSSTCSSKSNFYIFKIQKPGSMASGGDPALNSAPDGFRYIYYDELVRNESLKREVFTNLKEQNNTGTVGLVNGWISEETIFSGCGQKEVDFFMIIDACYPLPE